MTRPYATASVAAGLVAGISALGIAIGIANATPLSRAAAALKVDATSLIQVHGCNHTCRMAPVPEWGGVVAWHRHVGRFCRPISCTP